MTLREVLLYRIVSKLDEKCTKYMQSLKAKNALVNSVYYVTRYTIYNLVFSFHLFNITPVVECTNIQHFIHCFLKKKATYFSCHFWNH